MKKAWAAILTFLLAVGIVVSVKVLAAILATYLGGDVTVVP